MIDHDAKPGPLTRCQITGSDELNLIIDLGHQPPCDALITGDQLSEPEMTYPLRLMHCPESGLAQLDYVVPGREIYPPSYPYRAGISWPVVEAHKAMAARIVERFGMGLCIDIGCNDGTLLAAFKALGCPVFGVEPTDQAFFAQDTNGVPTRQAFFSESLAREIVADCGQANVVTFTNVFAHMAELGETMRGVCALLDKGGVLVVENHYLLDVLEKNQFDTVYHEHIRTYSLKAFCRLFAQYGMEVFDVERAPRYAGNIRVYVGWKGRHPVDASVAELLTVEDFVGLHKRQTWELWNARIDWARHRFMEFLYNAKVGGATVAGVSAPGRAATLLNYYGVTRDLMPYIGQLPTSEKCGKYIPGCHIRVVSNERIPREQPDYLVVLAWHYAKEIGERLRHEGVKSRLVVPLPEFRIT